MAAAAAASRTAAAAATGVALVARLDACLAGADAAVASTAGAAVVDDALPERTVPAVVRRLAAQLAAARAAVSARAASAIAAADAAAAAEEAAAAAARSARAAAAQAASDRAAADEAGRRTAAAQAAAAAAHEEATAAAVAAAAAAAATPPPPRISASAAAAAAAAAAAVSAAKAAGDALSAGGPAAAAEKRRLAKFITLQVTQVAGTRAQVAAKAGALTSALASLGPGPARLHALHTLAARLTAQCEAQVALHPASAFPLADVAAAVAAAFPEFDPLLRGRLASACPLTVPAYQPAAPERLDPSGHAFFEANGYERVEARGVGGGGHTWESSDAYCGRVRGYALFLGALPAAEGAPPAWLSAGWSYLARLLNALPANRATATALEGFLWSGGAALAAAHGRQFVKLLSLIDAVFLPALAASPDAETARAVGVRLRAYVHGGGWREVPEGRALPQTDASGSERA